MEPENKSQHLDDLSGQYKCPSGLEGRIVASKMNRGHFSLTTWGLKHVRIEPGFIVLDIGCGGGKTLERLAQRAYLGKVFGIDHSAEMVVCSQEVNRRFLANNRVEVVESSVEKTAFKNEFFDLVTAIETYYFWPNLALAFREIWRILKPGGSLLIVSEMIKDGVYEVENAQAIAKTHVRLLPLIELKRILQSAGFNDVKSFRKRKSPWNVILAKKQKPLLI